MYRFWVCGNAYTYSSNLKALTIQGVLDFDNLNFRQRIILPPGVCLTIRGSHLCSHILSLFTVPHDGHELSALLAKMSALTRLITTDDNEEILRSAIDSLGYPLGAVVGRLEE